MLSAILLSLRMMIPLGFSKFAVLRILASMRAIEFFEQIVRVYECICLCHCFAQAQKKTRSDALILILIYSVKLLATEMTNRTRLLFIFHATQIAYNGNDNGATEE